MEPIRIYGPSWRDVLFLACGERTIPRTLAKLSLLLAASWIVLAAVTGAAYAYNTQGGHVNWVIIGVVITSGCTLCLYLGHVQRRHVPKGGPADWLLELRVSIPYAAGWWSTGVPVATPLLWFILVIILLPNFASKWFFDRKRIAPVWQTRR